MGKIMVYAGTSPSCLPVPAYPSPLPQSPRDRSVVGATFPNDPAAQYHLIKDSS